MYRVVRVFGTKHVQTGVQFKRVNERNGLMICFSQQLMANNKDVSNRENTRIAIQGLRDRGHRICDIIRMGFNTKVVKTWFHRNCFKEKKGKATWDG